MPTHTAGEFISNLFGLHMDEKGFSYKQYVDIGTDVARSKVRKACGFTAHVKSISSTH
jgi:hypothetical protein